MAQRGAARGQEEEEEGEAGNVDAAMLRLFGSTGLPRSPRVLPPPTLLLCLPLADRTMRIVDGLPAADALGSSSGAASSDAGKPTKRSDRIAQLRQRVGEDSSGGKGGDEEGEGGYQDAQDALEEMIEEVGG